MHTQVTVQSIDQYCPLEGNQLVQTSTNSCYMYIAQNTKHVLELLYYIVYRQALSSKIVETSTNSCYIAQNTKHVLELLYSLQTNTVQ